MAVTTSTVQTDRILPELINEQLGPASRARVVALNHCSLDSIAGLPTKTKAYPRAADDGAASSATEGTDITATTTMSLGTQLTLSVTEGAGVRSDVTNTTVERRAPGLSGQALIDAVLAGDGRVLSIFAEEFARHNVMAMEKVETDVMALLDDFSTSVGSTGVNFSLADAESAMYQLTNLETGRENQWVFLLAPIQVSDLRNEIAISSGGAVGPIWSTDIQSITSMNASLPVNGLAGSLFGIPVYQTATSVNPSPNGGADEAGALLVSGMGRGPNDMPGALQFLEGNPIKYTFEYDASARHTELVTTYEYAVGERFDDFGVSIITDA